MQCTCALLVIVEYYLHNYQFLRLQKLLLYTHYFPAAAKGLSAVTERGEKAEVSAGRGCSTQSRKRPNPQYSHIIFLKMYTTAAKGLSAVTERGERAEVSAGRGCTRSCKCSNPQYSHIILLNNTTAAKGLSAVTERGERES